MRSSIACARCRRSKVKCINNGVNTTCRACEATGRECTYPSPASAATAAAAAGGAGATAKRDAHSTAAQADGINAETTQKRHPRPRKAGVATTANHVASKDSPKAMVDALDPNVLTPKVWTELFDIFQLHFSTELPFLHPPTFLKPLRQSNPQSSPVDSQDRTASPFPPGSHALLLAFLALTSRFHSTLIALHSPSSSSRPSNPLAASEYYAAAATAKLAGNFGDALGTPTLERTQALLMLSLHEWGMCRGSKAWIMAGMAVRSAQILGMQFEEDLDDLPLARSTAFGVEAHHLGLSPAKQAPKPLLSKNDALIEEEIRRRTFWSCFIMDRFLSSGKYRPQMLNIADIRVQLPSSERAFLFGEKVKTRLLGEELDAVAGRAEVQSQRRATVLLGYGRDHSKGIIDEDSGRWETGNDEGPLSRYIKVLELYGQIVRWSCGGGRRRERFPPWDPRSTFYELEKLLANFKDSLPRDLTLSPANTSAHITSRTSTPYILLHSVLTLCHVMLHREYIPFVPIRCSKPQGPLDPPLFPPNEFHAPPGFWDSSAREMFKSSRDLIDLLRTCQEWGTVVETPIVGFAAYTVANTGVYAINFPWMDPEGFMCNRTGQEAQETGGAEAARKALEVIGQMRRRLQMADGWFKTIKRIHLYYVRIKKDFKRNSKALEAMGAGGVDYSHLSLREGGAGGGFEEYKLIERTLKEFGSIEDEELDMMDVDPETSSHLEDGSDAGSTAVKSESLELQEGSPEGPTVRQDRWNAINSSNTLPPITNGHSKPSQSPYHNSSEQGQFRPGRGGVSAVSPYLGGTTSSYDRGIYNPIQSTGQPIRYSSSQPQPASFSIQPHPQQQTDGSSDNWLNNLDTRFGGDDLAAFVAGENWNQSIGVSGWLSTVWGGGSVANNL